MVEYLGCILAGVSVGMILIVAITMPVLTSLREVNAKLQIDLLHERKPHTQKWVSVAEKGMPTTGIGCYCVWNGSYWTKASYLSTGSVSYFLDYADNQLNGITHYIHISDGPDDY